MENEKNQRKRIVIILLIILVCLFGVKLCVDTQNKHSLTIIINEELNDKKSVNIISGKKYKLKKPQREGYTFDGWSITDSSSKIDDSIFTMGKESTEIIAQWEPVTYTIEYITNNDEIIETVQYTIETENFELQNPKSMQGYKFEGWYSNKEFLGNQFQTIEKGSFGNKKLYAKWDPKKYTINYKLNGGYIESAEETYTIESETFKINNPTKKGYIFMGWSNEDGSSMTKQLWIEKGTTGNKTFVANWAAIEYSIYYQLNGGIVDNDNVTNYTVETNTFTINNPTKKDYLFAGWTTEQDEKVKKELIMKKGTIGNKTFIANWTPVNFKIQYNLNGGTISNTPITNYNIETKTFNLPTPTKKGYNFKGWYDSQEMDGTVVSKIEKGTTGEKQFFAKWEPIVYTIEYELNEGNQSETALKEYTIEMTPLNLEVPHKDGYQFKGWYENNTNLENVLKSGTIGNKKYYAKWEKIKDYTGYNLYDVVSDGAVLDSKNSLFVTNEKGIQFGVTSSIANGYGVYTYANSINDNFPVHYYRGDVDNNNVLFGGFCWKIVRTTGTGGTKLIYNGTATNGACISTGSNTQLKNTKFYSSANHMASGGYSRGTTYTLSAKKYTTITNGIILSKGIKYENGGYTLVDQYIADENFLENRYEIVSQYHYTCFSTSQAPCTSVNYIYYMRENDKTVNYLTLTNGDSVETAIFNVFTNSANTTKSTIRTSVDNWYASNLTSYTNYLEDTIWCNDRSVHQLSGWAPDGNVAEVLHYGGYARNVFAFNPGITCPNKNDSFTVSPVIGNGSLEYPVGMLTIDETTLGGYVWFEDSTNSYLDNGKIWWTMSPGMLGATNNYMFVNYSILDHVAANFGTSGIRPSVSVKYGVEVKSGNGTQNNPFILN